MSDSDFVQGIVDILERGQDSDLGTMRESFYVWAWRRAREIHELKLRQEMESRPMVLVKMERP